MSQKLKRALVKLGKENPALRKDIRPVLDSLKKSAGRLKLEQDSKHGFSFSIGGPMDREGKEWKIMDSMGNPDMRVEADSYKKLRKMIEEAMKYELPEKYWRQIVSLLDGGNTAKVHVRPARIRVSN